MSFSVSFIGKPDAIKRKLEAESARLTDQSKAEFDAIKPALEAVLDQNVGNGVLQLNANGHASFTQREIDGSAPPAFEVVKTYGSCSVEVKTLGQIAE